MGGELFCVTKGEELFQSSEEQDPTQVNSNFGKIKTNMEESLKKALTQYNVRKKLTEGQNEIEVKFDLKLEFDLFEELKDPWRSTKVDDANQSMIIVEELDPPEP